MKYANIILFILTCTYTIGYSQEEVDYLRSDEQKKRVGYQVGTIANYLTVSMSYENQKIIGKRVNEKSFFIRYMPEGLSAIGGTIMTGSMTRKDNFGYGALFGLEMALYPEIIGRSFTPIIMLPKFKVQGISFRNNEGRSSYFIGYTGIPFIVDFIEAGIAIPLAKQ